MATKLNRLPVFLGQANCHLYHYGNNNPIVYTDPDGRDVAVDVTDENLTVGHTRLFFQDENGDWYRYDQGWNGVSDFACSIGFEESGKANVLGLLLGSDAPSKVSITPVDGPVEGAYLIKTSVEQDKLIAAAAQESKTSHNVGGKKYNLYTNNCTDSVVDILNKGGVHLYNPETTPLRAYFKSTGAMAINPVLGLFICVGEVNKLINTMPIFWQKRALSSKQ